MLGIDVSKASLVCELMSPQRTILWRMTVDNSPSGVQTLLKRAPAEHPWVLEPTGRYSLLAVTHALSTGRDVRLAPTRQGKQFLNSLQSRAKTDKLDAHGLALFGLSRELPAYPVKRGGVLQLHELITARDGIVASTMRLRQQAAELDAGSDVLLGAAADLDARKQQLDEQIASLLAADSCGFPEADKLMQVPGIGPVTAAAAVCTLKAIPFKSADAFVAYIGMDIGVVQSGTRAGQLGLTKQGNARLRTLFFNCAKSSIRTREAPFQKHYQTQLARGHCKQEAICSVARKLARLCWSMVHHGTDYAPRRVTDQKAFEAPAPAEPCALPDRYQEGEAGG